MRSTSETTNSDHHGTPSPSSSVVSPARLPSALNRARAGQHALGARQSYALMLPTKKPLLDAGVAMRRSACPGVSE